VIGFLSGLWGRFAAIGALVLAVLAAYLRIRSVDRAGAKAEARVDSLERTLEIKDAQQKAAAAAPRDRAALDKRLRDGSF